MTAPRIIISPGLWRRRVEVRVDPPRADHPFRSFASHAQATAFAHQLAALRGWDVVDECQPEREA